MSKTDKKVGLLLNFIILWNKVTNNILIALGCVMKKSVLILLCLQVRVLNFVWIMKRKIFLIGIQKYYE